MNHASAGGALIALGAVGVLAGVLMYVLPGPGLPVLVAGAVLTAAGSAVRLLGGGGGSSGGGRNGPTRPPGP
ncbi:hypothetical protein [Streptomyces sp. NPDC029526]|uniref:hypothetical protein n=1 Tax=Streptomyces sp. NPDC029526 TaxID=3155728 RepID=UPI0033E012CB